MFENLQKKWGVRGGRFFLILITFAVTGTFTAWMSGGITEWLNVDRYSASWWFLKAFVLIIGYQAFILFFGFCFGQFAFFWNFEKKILSSLHLMRKEKINRIAIFASGSGSNAEKIIMFFKDSPDIKVALVVSNRENAGVLGIAKRYNIKIRFLTKDRENENELLHYFKKEGITYLILAGYLWKVPGSFIQTYQKRIINIHPALLPKFGGKGMYGMRVHETVINEGEAESGITIHYVDEKYDNGEIIFQERIAVRPEDTAETLAKKIQALEHKHFPEVIQNLIKAKSALKQPVQKSRIKNLV